MPRTSFTIRLEILPRTSYGSFAQSAVIPSSLVTARIATTFNEFTPGLPHGLTNPTSPIVDIAGIGGTHKTARCPGTNERNPGDNSTPFTYNGTLACDPSQVPLGP